MKINKLKILSIAVCCAVTALWSEAQGTDDQDQRNHEHIRHYQAELSPAGSIMAFAGEIAPHGWLLCDGERYHNQRYLELYQVVGMKYVNGSVHQQWVTEANARDDRIWFCVPDLRGRVIVGVDDGGIRVTSNNTLGASAGEESHQLTVPELAIHEHNFYAHTHYINSVEAQAGSGRGIAEGSTRQTTSTGGNQPHNNMQPYQVLNYIISTGEMKRREENLSISTGIIDQIKRQISELNISLSNLSKQDPRGCAKAWVVFSGSAPTILNSYGVSSVIKNSTGNYTINFSTPFSSLDYCFSLSPTRLDCALLACASSQTQQSFVFDTFKILGWVSADPVRVSACFFGNQ